MNKKETQQKQQPKNGNRNGQYKGLTREQAIEFVTSEDYCEATAKSYQAYYLLTKAEFLISEVYEVLERWGINDMNSMKADIKTMHSAFDRFEKKFSAKFIPHDASNHEHRREAVNDGCKEIDDLVEQMVKNTIEQGVEYCKYKRIHYQTGKSCVDCLKHNTRHCPMSSKFSYPEEVACYGWQPKIGEEAKQ